MSRHLISAATFVERSDLSDSEPEMHKPKDDDKDDNRVIFHQCHPPLWMERHDPTGRSVGTWHCPGDYLPGRDAFPPLDTHEDDDESNVRYTSVQQFIDDWVAESAGSPEPVLLFGLSGPKQHKKMGLKEARAANWNRADIKAYWANDRNSGPNNSPQVHKSLMPIVVGPIESSFRPRCIVNLDNHPDIDADTMTANATLDAHFRQARWLSTNWGSTSWQTSHFNTWALLEAGDVKFYFCTELNKEQRALVDGASAELNPADHGIDVWDLAATGPTIVFIPPGCRWKVVFFVDSLISVGQIIMKDRKNSLPYLPQQYNAAGETDGSNVVEGNGTRVCMVQSRP